MSKPIHAVTPSAKVITIQQHILLQEKKFPGASGEFSWLLSGLTLAAKMIEAAVRRAGLNSILGQAESSNTHGEVQQKLDIYANEVMLHNLGVRESVGVLASEENETPIIVHNESNNAKYAILFDPLDGSSNIDVNVSVGTTFSIYRRPIDVELNEASKWVLQPGDQQVAAGYIIYGSSTVMVYSAGRGVHGFTLDPAIGAFILSHEDIRMPEHGIYYSVNEAYADTFPEGYRKFLAGLRQGVLGRKYSSRYIGSMIADFHRTLLKGGIFLYPPTDDHPNGKLRLLYEANPIAFIAEHAGGIAINGSGPILKMHPTSIHQRTPLIAGSPSEMNYLIECLKAE